MSGGKVSLFCVVSSGAKNGIVSKFPYIAMGRGVPKHPTRPHPQEEEGGTVLSRLMLNL